MVIMFFELIFAEPRNFNFSTLSEITRMPIIIYVPRIPRIPRKLSRTEGA